MVGKKIYLHGGIGAIGDGERFGDNYELPNRTAYAETCAAIGSVFWDYRMFLLHGDGRYIDVLEKTLYNGLLSGVGLDGKSFFYTNALQVNNSFTHPDLEPARSGWFTCSCCPTNLCRLIPSVPGYVYAYQDNRIFVNLYISSSTEISLGSGNKLRLEQESNYPWEADIKMRVDPQTASDFSLLLRVPGWARNEAIPGDLYQFQESDSTQVRIKVNGEPIQVDLDKGYAVIKRKWKKGDRVELLLPMKIKKVKANPQLKEDLGKLALQRGPIVYCAEWPDNDGKTSNLVLAQQALFSSIFRPDLLHGVETLESDLPAIWIEQDGLHVETRQQAFLAIPYYAWANRGAGEMNIWFPSLIRELDLISK
jgi:uncharacterized protein